MSSAPVVRAPSPAPSRPARPRGVVVGACLAVAAASAVGVWWLWHVFVSTRAGQLVETAAYDGAEYGQTRLWQGAEQVLSVVSVGFIAAVLIGAMLIAVLRRRWELAVQVAVLMVGANLTTRFLKLEVFDRPELGGHGQYGNTLPSGHTTAAASASAALLLVVPPRVRPWAALIGAGYTTLTGVSTLIGQWHRPSDVVAAILVVLAWTALTCAMIALRPARGGAGTATGAVPRVDGGEAPPTPAAMRGVLAVLFVAGAGAGASAAVALAHSWRDREDLTSRADQVTAYLGGAAGTLMAACFAFAVMLVLRQAAASRMLDDRT